MTKIPHEELLINIAEFREDAIAWGASLVEPTRETIKVLQEFGICMTNAATAMSGLKFTMFYTYNQTKKRYKEIYGRLPGSERTKRLRKKRHDAILRFMYTGRR